MKKSIVKPVKFQFANEGCQSVFRRLHVCMGEAETIKNDFHETMKVIKKDRDLLEVQKKDGTISIEMHSARVSELEAREKSAEAQKKARLSVNHDQFMDLVTELGLPSDLYPAYVAGLSQMVISEKSPASVTVKRVEKKTRKGSTEQYWGTGKEQTLEVCQSTEDILYPWLKRRFGIKEVKRASSDKFTAYILKNAGGAKKGSVLKGQYLKEKSERDFTEMIILAVFKYMNENCGYHWSIVKD